MASCSDDDDQRGNPFLINVGFQTELNTNLPQYSSLNFVGGVTIVPNAGLRGVVIFTLNTDNYVAYELSDPNHPPSACSTMQITGTEASCPCPDDANTYDIVLGQQNGGGSGFPMKAYRAVREGDVVRVFN